MIFTAGVIVGIVLTLMAVHYATNTTVFWRAFFARVDADEWRRIQVIMASRR